MTVNELPAYDDLPEAPHGGRSGWGVFGPDDNVGLMNLLTPERILDAAKLIRRGVVFPMNHELDAVSPSMSRGRGAPRRQVLHAPGSVLFDEVYDNVFPQASSQWDSLGHVGYTADAYYNGATEADIAHGRRNTIDHWARRGIAGRAVVLDLPRTLGDSYRPGSSTAFSVEDLEGARAAAGVTIRAGDILIVHTGFLRWYRSQDEAVRASTAAGLIAPGIEASEDMCRYLWDLHVVAVASDTFAVEVTPPDITTPMGFIHRMLIGQFGMALGEFWQTDDLVEDCAEDGIYEGFLASAPINARGGLGSPANALVLK